jgi:hypothetical protein
VTSPDTDPDNDGPVPDLPVMESLSTALRLALDSTPKLPRDRAAIRLAMHYAGLLDDVFDRMDEITEGGEEDERVADLNRLVAMVAKLGPRFEATLDKLGMTPGARPAARGGEPGGTTPQASFLAWLQSGDTVTPAGVDPRAAVDPAVTAADAGD